MEYTYEQKLDRLYNCFYEFLTRNQVDSILRDNYGSWNGAIRVITTRYDREIRYYRRVRERRIEEQQRRLEEQLAIEREQLAIEEQRRLEEQQRLEEQRRIEEQLAIEEQRRIEEHQQNERREDDMVIDDNDAMVIDDDAPNHMVIDSDDDEEEATAFTSTPPETLLLGGPETAPPIVSKNQTLNDTEDVERVQILSTENFFNRKTPPTVPTPGDDDNGDDDGDDDNGDDDGGDDSSDDDTTTINHTPKYNLREYDPPVGPKAFAVYVDNKEYIKYLTRFGNIRAKHYFQDHLSDRIHAEFKPQVTSTFIQIIRIDNEGKEIIKEIDSFYLMLSREHMDVINDIYEKGVESNYVLKIHEIKDKEERKEFCTKLAIRYINQINLGFGVVNYDPKEDIPNIPDVSTATPDIIKEYEEKVLRQKTKRGYYHHIHKEIIPLLYNGYCLCFEYQDSQDESKKTIGMMLRLPMAPHYMNINWCIGAQTKLKCGKNSRRSFTQEYYLDISTTRVYRIAENKIALLEKRQTNNYDDPIRNKKKEFPYRMVHLNVIDDEEDTKRTTMSLHRLIPLAIEHADHIADNNENPEIALEGRHELTCDRFSEEYHYFEWRGERFSLTSREELQELQEKENDNTDVDHCVHKTINHAPGTTNTQHSGNCHNHHGRNRIGDWCFLDHKIPYDDKLFGRVPYQKAFVLESNNGHQEFHDLCSYKQCSRKKAKQERAHHSFCNYHLQTWGKCTACGEDFFGTRTISSVQKVKKCYVCVPYNGKKKKADTPLKGCPTKNNKDHFVKNS